MSKIGERVIYILGVIVILLLIIIAIPDIVDTKYGMYIQENVTPTEYTVLSEEVIPDLGGEVKLYKLESETGELRNLKCKNSKIVYTDIMDYVLPPVDITGSKLLVYSSNNIKIKKGFKSAYEKNGVGKEIYLIIFKKVYSVETHKEEEFFK